MNENYPQVYYRSIEVAARFNKSVHDYAPLEVGRNFKDRFKPTGNIAVADDVPLPDVKTCLATTTNFIDLIKAGGYTGYSFWCWDTAPTEIWKFFRETSV